MAVLALETSPFRMLSVQSVSACPQPTFVIFPAASEMAFSSE